MASDASSQSLSPLESPARVIFTLRGTAFDLCIIASESRLVKSMYDHKAGVARLSCRQCRQTGEMFNQVNFPAGLGELSASSRMSMKIVERTSSGSWPIKLNSFRRVFKSRILALRIEISRSMSSWKLVGSTRGWFEAVRRLILESIRKVSHHGFVTLEDVRRNERSVAWR